MGAGCTWVFVGASAFLGRREMGRQILLGTMEAFALFLPAVAAVVGLLGWSGVMWAQHVYALPSETIWLAGIGTAVAVCGAVTLRSSSVRRTMRQVEGGRRTRR